MELLNLDVGLKYLASQGQTFNVHEIAGFNAGIAILQAQEKYNNVYVWGKINAVKGSYYIVYGLRQEVGEFPEKKILLQC